MIVLGVFVWVTDATKSRGSVTDSIIPIPIHFVILNITFVVKYLNRPVNYVWLDNEIDNSIIK